MTTVRAAQYWDVKMPPPKRYMVAGNLVKKVGSSIGMSFLSKSRRIGVEIHGPAFDAASVSASVMKGLLRGQSNRTFLGIGANELAEDDEIVIRILKPSKEADEDDDVCDDSSMSTLGLGGADEEKEGQWDESKRYTLHEITVLRIGKSSCDVKIGSGADMQIRQINFASAREVRAFYNELNKLRDLVKARELRRARRLSEFSKASAGFQVYTRRETDDDDDNNDDDGRGEDSGLERSSPSKLSRRDSSGRSYQRGLGDGSQRSLESAVSADTGLSESSQTLLQGSPNTNKRGASFEEVPTPLLTPEDDEKSTLIDSVGSFDYGGATKTSVLIEIVSAQNLTVEDWKSSDPFVVVSQGSNEIHRTKFISKTINPIWSIETGSLFLWEFNESFAPKELTFTVKDHDSITKNDFLGELVIQREMIMKGKGDRQQFQLIQNKMKAQPMLVLRFRPASESDVGFVQQLSMDQPLNRTGVALQKAFVPPMAHGSHMFGSTFRDEEDIPKLRVKPGPDVGREDTTTWMTEEEINAACLNHSTKWAETGSGTLGRLFVEVISCDQLGNSARGSVDKCDVYANILFEDSVVNTDVISNSRSPRWMPWSQRAFIFHISHASSQLLLGVLDFDSVTSHDPIGRVTIDITNFSPDTRYQLKYDLYTSACVNTRRKTGVLTVRVRVEWKAYRKAVLSSLWRQDQNFINLERDEDYRAAHYTRYGREPPNKFHVHVLRSYVEELKQIQVILAAVAEAILAVVLWRSTFQLNLCCPRKDGIGNFSIKLPLHSAIVFLVGIVLVENLNLFPSIFCFAVAWTFLAAMQHRRAHPSQWHHSKSYTELLLAFLKGKPSPITVQDQDVDEVEGLLEIQESKEEESDMNNDVDTSSHQRHQEEASPTDESLNESISKRSKSSKRTTALMALASVLFPVQERLGSVCRAKRIIASILTWEEAHVAFLITTGSIILGLLFLFVPWGLLIRWLFRVVVWTLLGPWMMLIDIFFVQEKEHSGKDGGRATVGKRTRAQQEMDMTIDAWKKYLFGKNALEIPNYKSDRYRDTPLVSSTAYPIGSTKQLCFIAKKRKGQMIVGEMVPLWKESQHPVVEAVHSLP